ncbi:hypothetical protein NMG60_11018347 [Bertholletia excelsa]
MKTPLPSTVGGGSSTAFHLLRRRLSPYYFFTALAFFLFVNFRYSEDFACFFSHRAATPDTTRHSGSLQSIKKAEENPAFATGTAEEGCDVFSGRWVRDEENRPLYEEQECPYIQPQLTSWRWQPHSCDLPSFNATMMLESLRGKRMMFVGDSLNRGQYVSMVCLLHRVIPEGDKSMETNGSLTHGKHWKEVDVLVFNTFLWWMTGQKFKILQGSFDDEVKDIIELSTEDAYRMAMKSMLRWVKKNMDAKKNRVFFTSMSPYHVKMGRKPNGNCYNETTPIEDPTYWNSDSRKSIMQVIGEEFGRSKFPITLLTSHSSQVMLTIQDAHTSIYKKQWSRLTPEQLANPVSYADCVHWCLPGLQDTWNELLFAKLFYP